MNLAIDITSLCRIRVILVPISPIRQPAFNKYAQLIKSFHTIRLGDVTPNLNSNDVFSSQVFPEGHLRFDFVSNLANDHLELQDFEPYRRIFGVIGILDCQEWKDKSLTEGYEEMMKESYPTAVVTRCFAFDPTENQADNAKGLIMIPNIGNMSFYMSTMMNDFANEILSQFSVIANRIQSLEVLESPVPTTQISSHFQQRCSQQKHSMLAAEELKRRTPGRIKKLLGDFYLLAGRLPDAVHHFEQAIEMERMTEDYLWLASAIEGRVCALILLEYIQMDVGHIATRDPYTPEDQNQSISTISSIAEQYRLVASNYIRMRFTGSFPDLVYVECCLRISRLLATAYLNQGWNETTMGLLVQRKLYTDISAPRQQTMKIIPRNIIGQWVTKVFEADVSEMSLLNQVHITGSMSSLYSCIGYNRKAAWLKYRSMELMLPLLIQHSRACLFKSATGQDIGAFQLLEQICEVYGVGEYSIYDNNALEKNKKDFSGIASSSVRGRSASSKNKLFLGWPLLQVDVLKQCISVSEALLDNKSQLYYTAVLLKSLYQYISKPDQIRLATSIQAMATNTAKKKLTNETMINYWGVNIIANIVPKNPIPRKEIYVQSIYQQISTNPKESKENVNDPFIYNPFIHKETKNDFLLVKNDLCEFKVTLFNPFGFDLEVRNIMLSTSGITFQSVSTAVSIPANATTTILLAGTPKETGTLTIRGCIVQIVGFLEQEFLVEPGNNHFLDEKVVKIKKSGLDAIKHRNKTTKKIAKVKEENFYSINVVDEQPLLKIKNTSMLHDAMMLYEGETTYITIEIENIGNTSVDFVKLSFTESTTTPPLPFNHNLSLEEQYEAELNEKKTPMFSWQNDSSIENHIGPIKEIWLPPGRTGVATVKVYGKRNCCGGSIQIDYGYLNRSHHEENENVTQTAFYTRQLYINVLLTVYQNLEPSNWEFIYTRHAEGYSTRSKPLLIENGAKKFQKFADEEYKAPSQSVIHAPTDFKIEGQDRSYYCFVSLDITNAWTTPFDVTFSISNDDCEDMVSNITTQPGCTARILLPIKRLFLPLTVCLKNIPSIDPNKQFIKSRESEEQQYIRKQLFWYREELLKRIKGAWRCPTTGRNGILNLRPFVRLTDKQLAIIKKENVEFSIDVQGNSVRRTGRCIFECEHNKQLKMNITIRNRLAHVTRVILRIQPIQGYADNKNDYRFPEDMLIEGIHQVLLDEMSAEHGKVTHSFPICFLSSGRFELLYHAEDINTRNIYYDHEWIIFKVVDPSVKIESDSL